MLHKLPYENFRSGYCLQFLFIIYCYTDAGSAVRNYTLKIQCKSRTFKTFLQSTEDDFKL